MNVRSGAWKVSDRGKGSQSIYYLSGASANIGINLLNMESWLQQGSAINVNQNVNPGETLHTYVGPNHNLDIKNKFNTVTVLKIHLKIVWIYKCEILMSR